MLRLNFVVKIFWVFLLLLLLYIGLSNGTEISNTTEPGSQGTTIIRYTIDGKTFVMSKRDEIIYYATAGTNKMFVYYCTDFNNDFPHKCINDYILQVFYDTGRDSQSGHQWILKTDIIVFYPIFEDPYYLIDVVVFNFPSFSLYQNYATNLKILIVIHHTYPGTNWWIKGISRVSFEDPEDKCREYRPKVITGAEMLKLNLFLNRKWTKYAYYFIKNDKHICAYSLNYEDLFRGAGSTLPVEIKPVNFLLIDTYPTHNYAADFFCIDPIYGTFVSLYWNHDLNSPPEAHYYIINEKDLKNIQLIDRMVLKGFDFGVLIDIFNNNFDTEYHPTFTSYGRQIFIWFKRPSENNRAFNGLWKNDDIHEIYFQELTGDKNLKDNFRKLWHGRRDYIQIDRPVGRLDAPSTPAPIPFTFPPTQADTTLKPSTITLPATDIPSITATTLSSTSSLPLSTAPTSTTIDQSLPSSTSSSSEFTNTESNDTPAMPAPLVDRSTHSSSSNNDCSNGDLYLYLLIALIVIDVMEAIILVILVILKYRGAKKLKEAMARKKTSKSKSSIKKLPTPKTKPLKEKKTKIPWGKKKKSIKEKSVTTKSEHAGGKTEDAAKKTTTTVDETNYYTVGETFDKTKK